MAASLLGNNNFLSGDGGWRAGGVDDVYQVVVCRRLTNYPTMIASNWATLFYLMPAPSHGS